MDFTVRQAKGYRWWSWFVLLLDCECREGEEEEAGDVALLPRAFLSFLPVPYTQSTTVFPTAFTVRQAKECEGRAVRSRFVLLGWTAGERVRRGEMIMARCGVISVEHPDPSFSHVLSTEH